MKAEKRGEERERRGGYNRNNYAVVGYRCGKKTTTGNENSILGQEKGGLCGVEGEKCQGRYFSKRNTTQNKFRRIERERDERWGGRNRGDQSRSGGSTASKGNTGAYKRKGANGCSQKWGEKSREEGN